MALTTVASQTTAIRAVPQNAGRQGLVIENSDANRLYVLIGPGTASASNYSFSLAQNENAALPNCREQINLVWDADGTGSAYITEY